MFARVRRVVAAQDGESAVEYALMLSLIYVAAVVGLKYLGAAMLHAFNAAAALV